MAVLNVPARHDTHAALDDEPRLLLYVPAGHSTSADSALAPALGM